MCKYFYYSLIIFLFVTSCKRSKYEGYSITGTGVHYKLNYIGETGEKARIGDFVTIDIAYKTLEDSIFFKGKRKIQVSLPEFEGAIDECFLMMAEGDKADFIINAKDFFSKTLDTSTPSFLGSGQDMKIGMEMLEIQTGKEYEYEKEAFLTWIEDFGEYEKTILKQFMREEKVDAVPTASGMYFLTLKKGNNKNVVSGDTVVVHYEGKFLNGKFFDSTVKRKEPFKFVYGQKWQVIEGIEEAIGMMSEGQKVLLILPSDLAFGRTGSSTGIIPPMTSVIFEVELLKVDKKDGN